MSLGKRFQDALLRTGTLPTGCRVLVAVSGGADSVALLHLLVAAADRFGLQLLVAHLDHGLREESAAEAGFVRRLAEGLDLPVCLERIDVSRHAQDHGLGLEEAGREVRRAFLTRMAEEYDADRVALGHHRDDQAETFLMRLLRGTGPAGLAAMRPVSGRFVRPMLPFSRQEVIAYLREQGLRWCEDESNRDLAFTRNRIRCELLPQLQEFNPNIVARLAELCEVFGREEDYWSSVTTEALQRCRLAEDDGLRLSCRQLGDLPRALAFRVVRQALEAVRGDLRQISAVHINDVFSLTLSDAPQADLDLPSAWVGRRYEELWFRTQRPQEPAPVHLVVTGPGVYLLPGGRRLKVGCHAGPAGETVDSVEFDLDAASFPLLVRSWQTGDRFQPAGMSGTKKLQDLFVDAKLSREQRSAQLVVDKDGRILWVVGLRRCDGSRAEGDGGPVLRLSLAAAD